MPATPRPTLLPTLLLVRPQAQAAQQAQRLQAAGITAQPFCVEDTVADDAALAALPAAAMQADWLVFVSPSCIDLAWPHLADLPLAANLACVGRASADKLAVLSGRAVLHPPHGNDSDALLTLPPLQQLAGQTVLIVRGDGGRPQLGETLAHRGARVHYAEVYRRVPVQADWALFDRLAAAGPSPALLITSSHSAQQLFHQAGATRRRALLACRFIALHPRIAATLQQLGVVQPLLAADEHALCALLTGPR
ncbi:uroporphyrinogen-III synthase [Vogesella indigofera]|uniref:uroporphyrinogen-III synthase n=1 Tax=Vogesella indigofera TaxID=45465 RepID=UPI00234EC9A4|nr:uroporphyrinogen-III synthase [Vogesella indigofera]MDC7701205.1 uroporphyrinogen-III synthase [Vogesella indigofera]